MKITKTNMKVDMGNGSSYIVYVAKSLEDANTLHSLLMTQREIHHEVPWYYTVSTTEGADIRVPEFFHGHGYWFTIVEHNNGDWNIEPTYTLYTVE